MFTLTLTFLFLLFSTHVYGFSTGAPSDVCTTITPGHGGGGGTIPGGFYLYSDLIDCGGQYTANTAYTIRLQHQSNTQFRGFLIQARQSGTTTPIGTFSALPSGTQLRSCSGASSASVTHSNNNLKTSVEFTWTSPSTAGTVEFRYAVVVQNSGGVNTFFANINAGDNRPSGSSCSLTSSAAMTSTMVPSSSSMVPSSSSMVPSSSSMGPSSSSMGPSSSSMVQPTSTVIASSIQATSSATEPTPTPTCPSTNKDASSSFPLVIKTPSDCDRESCTLYIAMGNNTANPQYLDVYMEGTADGWIAVGFSINQLMGSSDVLVCRVDNSNTVTVVDSWNPGPNPRTNTVDSNSNGLCTHSTSFTNGRISCLFSRTAAISNPGQDFNLDGSYYIISGLRTSSQPAGGLLPHTSIPSFSTTQYNPMRDTTRDNMPSNNDCPTPPSSDAVYSVRVGNPGDNYYFAARTNSFNSSFIDIQLEGAAEGWVAVGFTSTVSMFESDVLACKRDSSSDTVYVIDTWNPSGSRSNILDASQSGVCPHETQYANGRISCTFSRYIGVIDNGQDLDLNQSLYRIYSAFSSSRSPPSSALGYHDNTPTFSSARSSLLTDIRDGSIESVSSWPRRALIKTHGVIMIISWILLATTGVFFASWMKPVLPNGEWFQVHRGLMIGSLFVGAVGFAFAFIANAKGTMTPGLIIFSPDGKNTAHFICGIIIMCLHIANPLIAICRCKPSPGGKRWIFNLGHAHIIGYGALILALTNIAIGTHLIDQGSFRIAGFYIVSFMLYLIYQVVLFIIHTVNAFMAPESDRPYLVHSLMKYMYLFGKSDEKKEEQEMTSKNDEKKEEPVPTKPERKKPLESALVGTSWISSVAHMVAVIIVVLVLIILIAIE